MNAEFKPHLRQQNMFNRLIRLSIEDFMTDGRNEADALRKIILEINRLARMARPLGRYDEHLKLFLENEVSNTFWGYLRWLDVWRRPCIISFTFREAF